MNENAVLMHLVDEMPHTFWMGGLFRAEAKGSLDAFHYSMDSIEPESQLLIFVPDGSSEF